MKLNNPKKGNKKERYQLLLPNKKDMNRRLRMPGCQNVHPTSTILHFFARGAPKIPQANVCNGKSHPNLTMNIHNSSGYSRGTAQIPQANTINDKSRPNLITNIHNSSGYAKGTAQIPQANAISDMSHPNSTTNIRNSSGYV